VSVADNGQWQLQYYSPPCDPTRRGIYRK